MNTEIVCIPCILEDVLEAAQTLPEQALDREVVARQVLSFLGSSFRLNEPPSTYITGVHRLLKRISGVEVPFADLRERVNQVGIKFMEKIREEVKKLEDFERFRRLVTLAVGGNDLDFRTVGTGYELGEENLEFKFAEAISRPLLIDEVDRIYRELGATHRVLYIHDNVGEIALDRCLIEMMVERGLEVVSALRGGAITSDATVEDGYKVGLDAVAQVICTGPDTLGISFQEMTQEMERALEWADLVISKGQANYYVISQYRSRIPGKVAFLLRTKCDLVASQFRSMGKIGVAVLG